MESIIPTPIPNFAAGGLLSLSPSLQGKDSHTRGPEWGNPHRDPHHMGNLDIPTHEETF